MDRALTTMGTGCCKTDCVVCVINRNIRIWMVAMLRCFEVTMCVGEHGIYSIAVCRPCQPWKCVCWEQLLFFLLIVQEAAIPLCDWSTTTADSYPSIIPIVVDVWALMGYFPLDKYPIQRQCFWYVRLHICDCGGHTMYHDGLFDNWAVSQHCDT